MPAIAPFGLDGNPKSLPPFVIKGKGLCSPSVHAKFFDILKCAIHAPPDYKQGLQKDVLQEEHDSIHHK